MSDCSALLGVTVTVVKSLGVLKDRPNERPDGLIPRALPPMTANGKLPLRFAWIGSTVNWLPPPEPSDFSERPLKPVTVTPVLADSERLPLWIPTPMPSMAADPLILLALAVTDAES